MNEVAAETHATIVCDGQGNGRRSGSTYRLLARLENRRSRL